MNFQSILIMLTSGIVSTMNQITGLLTRYSALSTILGLVLLNILVKRLLGKHIGNAGSSDMVSSKESGERYSSQRGD